MSIRDHEARDPDLRFAFGPELSAPHSTRRALWSLIGADGDPIASAVQTVASELVTNVVRHTRSGGEVRAWDPKPDKPFHLEVLDRDPTPLRRRSTSPGAHGGFGLHIVDQLSDAWGVDLRADGKAVWAEFNRPDSRSDVSASDGAAQPPSPA